MDLFKSEEIALIEKNNTEFLNYLTIKGGYEIPINLYNLWYLFDPLYIEVNFINLNLFKVWTQRWTEIAGMDKWRNLGKNLAFERLEQFLFI